MTAAMHYELEGTLQGRVVVVGAPDVVPVLGSLGLDVQTERSGDEFDVLIVDLAEAQALETIARHKESSRVVPILTVGTSKAALEAGADDCIDRPVAPWLLAARLGGLLERSQLSRRAQHLDRELARLEQTLARRPRELQRAHAALAEAAFIDGLTHLPNRRATESMLNQMWALQTRQRLPLACLMVDIDRFKTVNDTWGHEFGDTVLETIARRIRRAVRLSDGVGRWGGEEFVVVCPDTGLEEARVCAERIRSGVAAGEVRQHDLVASITVSVGVAVRQSTHAVPLDLVSAADKAMYHAKQAGRNCVRSVE